MRYDFSRQPSYLLPMSTKLGGFLVAKRKSAKRPLYRRPGFWALLCVPALAALLAGLVYFWLPDEGGEQVELAQFLQWAEAGEVESAQLQVEDERVRFVREDLEETYWFALPSTQQYMSEFVTLTVDRDIPLEIDQQRFKAFIPAFMAVVAALILVAGFVLIFLMIRSGGSGSFTKAGTGEAGDRPVTFADVAGNDEAVAEIREVRDYLIDPSRLEELGAEAPRGILLVGPPGTGKTLLARAVAGEAGVPFFSISGTDFVEMYVGVGASRVRDLFRKVREQAPAILFIDELDAMGRARSGGATAGQDERDQTLNQLLVELDGFSTAEGVVLLGATNRPDVLDPALLRRGRFDRQVVVDRPDRDGRRSILEVHASRKSLAPSVDLDWLAGQTTGFTGADLASVMNDAALLSARNGRREIHPEDLEEAIDRIQSGGQGRVRVLSAKEKHTVAYHESGHALIALSDSTNGPVTKISIVSRGRALGFTRMVDEEEKTVHTRGDLEHQLAVALGGRAAEELVLGEATTTAKDDLRRATDLARRMVCEFGMSSKLGRRALGRPTSGDYLGDGALQPDYSGEVAALIDREVQRLVDDAFEGAKEFLERHRSTLDRLAQELMSRETLRQDDLEAFTAAVRGDGWAVPRPPAEGEPEDGSPKELAGGHSG